MLKGVFITVTQLRYAFCTLDFSWLGCFFLFVLKQTADWSKSIKSLLNTCEILFTY